MNLRSIHRRLPLTYAGIALLTVLALGGVLLFTLRGYYAGLERRRLQGNAEGIAAALTKLLQAGAPDFMLQDQVQSWAFFLQARVQLFDWDGRLLVDSGPPEARQVLTLSSPPGGDVFVQGAPPPAKIVVSGAQQSADGNAFWQMYILPEGEADEKAFYLAQKKCTATEGADAPDCGPVVVELKREAGGTGVSVPAPGQMITRTEIVTGAMAVAAEPVGVVMPYRSTLYGFSVMAPDEPLLGRSSETISRPLFDEAGRPVGSILLSDGPAYGQEILTDVARGWLFSGLAAVLLAGLVGWRVSRNITGPLRALSGATGRMAAGDLAARAEVWTDDEFGDLARSFNEMAGRVEATISTLRTFVGDAAHQLHTPLTALNANLELARDERDPERRQGYLAAVGEQTQRLQMVIDGLLELSRLEAGPAEHSLVDLRALVGALAEVYASQADQAGVRFDFFAPEEALTVPGDAAQLREAIANLLENALKFTPAGGEVRLSLEREPDGAVVTVEDTGIGLLAEDLPRLFERFHRGRNAAAYPGSGLGLAIVRSIAEAHSGQVLAVNRSPGARFVLHLPAASAKV